MMKAFHLASRVLVTVAGIMLLPPYLSAAEPTVKAPVAAVEIAEAYIESLPPAARLRGSRTNPFDRHRFVRTPNVWWLYHLKDARSGLPKDPRELENLLKKGVSVRITGFLSPIGGYGHMNGYDHEFFDTSIVRVEGD